jgi:imidazolonepropionase-like amidohydrolase
MLAEKNLERGRVIGSIVRAVLLMLAVATPSAAATQVTAIKAGKLVDPETGTTLTNQVIIVEDSTIKAVGSGLAIPTGAIVVDLSGMTVLPGLFDCHTHMCMTVNKARDNGNFFYTTLLDTTAFRAVQGVANARGMLESGFTTIRDVGNAANYADTALRKAIEDGIVPGPTMINAGRIIAPYGGQFHLQPEKRDFATPEYLFADSKDDLRRAVRENIHYGAKVIKLVVDDQPYIYSPDDIRFVIDEATRAGVKVAAHCWTEPGARNATEAGVASIEHGPEMSNETLELVKRNNVTLVGTDFPEAALLETATPDSPDAKQFHAKLVDRLARAYKLGVTIAFGTDAITQSKGQTRGTVAISFLDSFVEASVPPRAILQMMIGNAAKLVGVEKERGEIKPGLAADIIATPQNPLENIQTLKDVSFVMKNGVVIKNTKVPSLSRSEQ